VVTGIEDETGVNVAGNTLDNLQCVEVSERETELKTYLAEENDQNASEISQAYALQTGSGRSDQIHRSGLQRESLLQTPQDDVLNARNNDVFENINAQNDAHHNDALENATFVSLSKRIEKCSEKMFKEVMQTIRTAAVPQKITKQLHDQFRLQLVGLTKRLEFVLRVRSDEVEKVLGVDEDVQKVLAEVVPPSRRSQLTWSRLARQPMQCEEDLLSREASRMVEQPSSHAGQQENVSSTNAFAAASQQQFPPQDFSISSSPLNRNVIPDQKTLSQSLERRPTPKPKPPSRKVSDNSLALAKSQLQTTHETSKTRSNATDNIPGDLGGIHRKRSSKKGGKRSSTRSSKHGSTQATNQAAASARDGLDLPVADNKDPATATYDSSLSPTEHEGRGVQKETLGPALRQACLEGGVQWLRSLLKQGASVNAHAVNFMRPVHFACVGGSREILKELADSRADLLARDARGRTVMHFAVSCLNVDVVESLLSASKKFDANLYNLSDEQNQTPLHYAIGHYEDADHNSKKLLSMLLQAGAHIDATDTAGRTALHLAAKQGLEDSVKCLLEKAASANSADRKGRTAVHYACSGRMTESKINILVALAKVGADVKAADSSGQTGLHLAAQRLDVETAEWFMGQRIDVDLPDAAGRTPFLHACGSNGDKEPFLSLLLQAGADVRAKDKGGRTALHVAAERGDEACVHWLLQRDVDVDAADENGRTPLHNAAWKNNHAIVKTLLSSKACFDTSDNMGKTAVNYACERSIYTAQARLEVLQTLAHAGADLHVEDMDGQTALHLAAHSRDVDTAVWLLERGAEVNEADNKGETAFLKACQNANSNLLTTLINAGADKDVTDISGNTALHFAASGHNVETATWLLDCGADVNATDTELRQTPLHVACSLEHYNFSLPRLLVQRGADVNAKDAKGQTPVHVSAYRAGSFFPRWAVEQGLASESLNHAEDEFGHTPLHIACANGDYKAVQVLVENGADVGVRDKQGRLPKDLLENSNPFVNTSVRGHEECKALLPLLSPETRAEQTSR
jgi:ankyrin repeat protein